MCVKKLLKQSIIQAKRAIAGQRNAVVVREEGGGLLASCSICSLQLVTPDSIEDFVLCKRPHRLALQQYGRDSVKVGLTDFEH